MTTKDPQIGPALKNLRRRSGLTLQQVSDRAGVNLAHLSRVENGQVSPRPDWITLVVVALGQDAA